MTHYSVNGITVASEFSIAIRIEMEPSNMDFLSSDQRVQEDSIPIIIRSRKDGDFVHDLMNVQMTELKKLSKQVEDKYSFINNPLSLAGCKFGLQGLRTSALFKDTSLH